ncbi:MAG TPA: dynamin family protein, partial [Paenibacillus sp.]|nr:dynamin family protein [Paenibacillus sp.]
FELDKMFFVVNAADLASSEEELRDVLDHVEKNLAAFGVRNPRLFPVSSLKALEAKQAGDADAAARAGLAAFEARFETFAAEELGGLAYRAAGAELERAVRLAAKAVQGAKAGEQERQAALERLGQAEAGAAAELKSLDFEALRGQVEKEAAEQLYYVKQRFQFRFGEWYAASFNPSALRTDRGDAKTALAFAWRDLVQYLQTELVNEALAVSLRLERHLEKALAEAVARGNERAARVFEGYQPPAWESPAFRTPDIDEVWAGETPDAKLLASYYKNAKQFFEGDGRKALREALERRWQPAVAGAVDALNARLDGWIAEELARVRGETERALEEALAASVAAAREAWERPLDPAEAEDARDKLQALSEAFEATGSIGK